MCGATRIDVGRRAALLLVFAIALFCFTARCGAAPATAFVGEVASYGDYALQSGFFETFRDKLEEALASSGKLRVVMHSGFPSSTWTPSPAAIGIGGKNRGRR